MTESSVNPYHEGRLKDAQYYQQKINKKINNQKSWYELVKDKVIQKTKTQSGSVFSKYVGKYKDCKHLLESKGKRK